MTDPEQPSRRVLRFPAIATVTGGRDLYSFAVDGRRIRELAAVSHATRDAAGQVHGFQRGEAARHIREIAEYVSSEGAFIPNAVVVAFPPEAVRFEGSVDPSAVDGEGRMGVLLVDVSSDAPPGWIVDGQQRTMAIERSEASRFPVFVCAFVEGDKAALRRQFINVNSSKPLPAGLIDELLPGLVDTPEKYEIRKAAASLAERLAFDADSPLRGRVRPQAGKNGINGAYFELGSFAAPLAALLRDPQSIFGSHVDDQGRVGDLEGVVLALKEFWHAVVAVFPAALTKSTASRLTHGTGVWALLHVMDRIYERAGRVPEREEIIRQLNALAPWCHWTEADGDWQELSGFAGARPWNGFQNTAQDKRLLTGYLIRKFREGRSATAAS